MNRKPHKPASEITAIIRDFERQITELEMFLLFIEDRSETIFKMEIPLTTAKQHQNSKAGKLAMLGMLNNMYVCIRPLLEETRAFHRMATDIYTFVEETGTWPPPSIWDEVRTANANTPGEEPYELREEKAAWHQRTDGCPRTCLRGLNDETELRIRTFIQEQRAPLEMFGFDFEKGGRTH